MVLLGQSSTVERYTAPAVNYTLKQTATNVEAHEPTLQELAEQIAVEYEISTTTLANLVYSESRWNPQADNGHDRGLVQINRKHWPDITDEQAFDPVFALKFAAERLSEGQEHKWVACNCYLFAMAKIGRLPLMADIQPNTDKPQKGDLVILDYSGVKHLSVIESVGKKIKVIEANFEPCLIAPRQIDWHDPRIVGFWSKQPVVEEKEPETKVLYSKTEYL